MLILIPLLASCATTAGRVEHCTGWKPIIAADADILTDGTAKQILAHDEYGVTSGCWERPEVEKASGDGR